MLYLLLLIVSFILVKILRIEKVDKGYFMFMLILEYPILCFITDSLIRGITLINIALSVGNNVILFTNQYQGDTLLPVKTVFMMTILSIVTISLIISILL